MDWRRAPGVLVGVPLLVVLAQGLLAPEPAGASCAGPRVTISSGTVQPGGMVLVVGEGFGTDCNDTGGPGPPLGAPAAGIAVGFAQDGRTTTLGRVDAGDDYRVSLWMRIPETAHAGPAEIALGRTVPATATGRRRPTGSGTRTVRRGLPSVPSRDDGTVADRRRLARRGGTRGVRCRDDRARTGASAIAAVRLIPPASVPPGRTAKSRSSTISVSTRV